VIGTCVLGLSLTPVFQHPALASPSLGADGQGHPAAAVNLRLDGTSARRVMADLSGAAQEDDSEKPKSMEEKAKPPEPAAGTAAAAKKEKPPEDPFAFVKDWPFWVIVGGAVILVAGGYMLLRNSNDKAPCPMDFKAGCFP
jgi:uncharacterized membrane protein